MVKINIASHSKCIASHSLHDTLPEMCASVVSAHFPISILSMLRSIKRCGGRRWVRTCVTHRYRCVPHMQHRTLDKFKVHSSAPVPRVWPVANAFNRSLVSALSSSNSPLLHWNPFSLCVRSVVCVDVKRFSWHQPFRTQKKPFAIHCIRLRWFYPIFGSAAAAT